VNVDYEDPSEVFISENIEDSPFKKDKRINEDCLENFKIPEFPYNENNIKSVQKGLAISD
jgi:hypothetical protein